MILIENMQYASKILKDKKIPLDSEQFKKLKKLVSGNIGFIGILTKFFYINNNKFAEVESIYKKILDNRDSISKLPKELLKYDTIEELEDDLVNIEEWRLYNQNLVSKVISKFREEARADVNLKVWYTTLDSDDLLTLNKFFRKIRSYDKWSDFREDLKFYVRPKIDLKELEKEIDQYNNIYTIYNDNNILIAEVFDYKASQEFGSPSWCISYKPPRTNLFNTYASLKSENKQYFIWNNNVDSGDVNSMIGVTIDKKGSVRNAHTKDDSSIGYDELKSILGQNDVDISILKPLDLNVDYYKYVPKTGLIKNKQVVSMLSKYKKLQEYKDRIPVEYARYYGMLNDDEVNKLDISELKKEIIKKEKGEFTENLLNLLDRYDDREHDLEDDILLALSGLNFMDRLNFYNMYITHKHYYNSTYELIFEDCLSASVWDIDQKGDRFEIKLSEDEYCDNIINVSLDFFYSFRGRPEYSYDIYSNDLSTVIFDMSDETKKSLIDYLKLFKTANKNHTNVINDIINDLEDMSNINIDKTDLGDFFYEIASEMGELLEKMNETDINTFENAQVGDYDFGKWMVDIEDLCELVLDDIEFLYVESIDDLISCQCNDLSNINLLSNDTEYVSYHSYNLSTEDLKVYNEEVMKIIERYTDKIDLNDLDVTDLDDIHMKIKKLGYDSVKEDGLYYWVKDMEDYKYVIPELNIEYGGEITRLTLKSNVGSYRNIYSGNILAKEIIDIDSGLLNPNQTKMKFENKKIMSYQLFIESKKASI